MSEEAATQHLNRRSRVAELHLPAVMGALTASYASSVFKSNMSVVQIAGMETWHLHALGLAMIGVGVLLWWGCELLIWNDYPSKKHLGACLLFVTIDVVVAAVIARAFAAFVVSITPALLNQVIAGLALGVLGYQYAYQRQDWLLTMTKPLP